MFDKILIANRGEIACRVIATASRMGIKTVAVYSDADAGAQHVAMADEAVRIGPAPVADSYLRGDVIIQAALDTGAQAIHPGYGFLSENPDFVAATQAAGLVFIGPTAEAIRAMGLKDAAKALMVRSGVPVVPGYHGDNQDAGFLAAEAEKIGYPVLIKARAGGGGKGMRLVEKPGDFARALEGAQREGQASFGDPVCLIEKYVSKPRHIEIQVFGDSHGNVVHLFERDCSLQRRHQKVIEEAPAPDMPADVRSAMGKAAVEAAKAVGYQGAGTVEFICDGSGPLRTDGFWFMEMNTRLQVEHPVSEAITGLDFVALQLQVAAGLPLPFTQGDLSITGHAFEARIYAEDVPKGFLPATGTLDHLAFPDGTGFALGAVRIDSGVREGDAITPHYDPMIAKLIVHGATRAAALRALTDALAQTHVAGSVTNLTFLHALTRSADFAGGRVDTGLIAREIDDLTAVPIADERARALAAVLALDLVRPAGTDPWDRVDGWRSWGVATHQVTLDCAGKAHCTRVAVIGAGKFAVDGASVTITQETKTRFVVQSHGLQSRLHAVRHDSVTTVFADGTAHVFVQPDPLAPTSAAAGGGDLVISPMPGLVKIVHAVAGDAVTHGQPLLVLEAMKMEHTLTAPRDGVIAEIPVSIGTQVQDGAVLARMEPSDGAVG